MSHRAAALTVVALEAARVDDDGAATAAQLLRQRHVMSTWLVDRLLERTRLRDQVSREDAIHTIWLRMDPVVFCRLASDRQGTTARFRSWFTDAVTRLLLPR